MIVPMVVGAAIADPWVSGPVTVGRLMARSVVMKLSSESARSTAAATGWPMLSLSGDSIGGGAGLLVDEIDGGVRGHVCVVKGGTVGGPSCSAAVGQSVFVVWLVGSACWFGGGSAALATLPVTSTSAVNAVCCRFWRSALLRWRLLGRGAGFGGGSVVAIVISSDSSMLKHPRHEVLECCRSGEPSFDTVFEHRLYRGG